MPPQCSSGRRVTKGPREAWVNTDHSSQHKHHAGLCKAAMAHLATSQYSIPALCGTRVINLRIEMAGTKPTACWRNADYREMNSKTRNEARKEKHTRVCMYVKQSQRWERADQEWEVRRHVIKQAANFGSPCLVSVSACGAGRQPLWFKLHGLSINLFV